MSDIKIIALDLDGTLLNSAKELSSGNLAALTAAAEAGVEIVPTTGRFYGGMPAAVRTLPFVHYTININGAELYDVRADRSIGEACIPLTRALDIMRFLDGTNVIYDCYMDNWGWMTRSLQEKGDLFTSDVHYQRMIRELRHPVPDLKSFLAERGRDVQKIMLFAGDMETHARLFRDLPLLFPELSVSSSVSNNIEINHVRANKGEALLKLAAHLGCARENTIAFGDAVNDLSMVREAGIGVCMANGDPRVKAVADYISGTNDEDGVAEGIYRFVLNP